MFASSCCWSSVSLFSLSVCLSVCLSDCLSVSLSDWLTVSVSDDLPRGCLVCAGWWRRGRWWRLSCRPSPRHSPPPGGAGSSGPGLSETEVTSSVGDMLEKPEEILNMSYGRCRFLKLSFLRTGNKVSPPPTRKIAVYSIRNVYPVPCKKRKNFL